MKRRQLDLYAECNVEPRAPMDVFTAECCARCVNPECLRSNFSNSKFESRVSNWYERLFSNVPRMAPDDERFRRIAGQKFLLIDPAGSTSAPSQGWVDPRSLRTTSVQVPVRVEPPQATPDITQGEPVALTPELRLEAQSEPEPQSEPVQRAPASAELALVNTPVRHGQMLGGKPLPSSAEWLTPAPTPRSDDKVVKTGAKIRIGS